MELVLRRHAQNKCVAYMFQISPQVIIFEYYKTF